jgi:SWI/SNF-related matrix-associated actin-dependent regulator 1 of chromatin subfamily A
LQYQFKREQVQVIDKSGTNINLSAKIIIYSYELAVKSLDQIRNIQTVIADEAHYLKNHNAKRTESLMPFLTTRKRVFLLTGTPALAKPR